MCLATPMQVVRVGVASALCRGRNGDEEVNMLLVGEQPVGTWVLTFLGWAREVISEQHASEINLALDGLQEIMNGADAIDVDRYFPGAAKVSSETGE